MELLEEISAHYYIIHVCCCIMYTYYYTMHIYYCIIKFYTNLYCMYATLHNVLYVCPLVPYFTLQCTQNRHLRTVCTVHTCVYTAAIVQYMGLFPVGSRQTRGHHCMVGDCFVHTPNSCWITKHPNNRSKGTSRYCITTIVLSQYYMLSSKCITKYMSLISDPSAIHCMWHFWS